METATCIVALAYNGKVWLGGDSAASNVSSEELSILTNKKVFSRTDKQKNKWLFGFMGTYRFGQLLQYQLELPELVKADEKDLLGFLVKKLIPALHTCLKDNCYEQTDKNRSVGEFFWYV